MRIQNRNSFSLKKKKNKKLKKRLISESKKRASKLDAMNWRNFLKEFLKISRIFSQYERYYIEIWNLKDVTSIDREDFKT